MKGKKKERYNKNQTKKEASDAIEDNSAFYARAQALG